MVEESLSSSFGRIGIEQLTEVALELCIVECFLRENLFNVKSETASKIELHGKVNHTFLSPSRHSSTTPSTERGASACTFDYVYITYVLYIIVHDMDSAEIYDIIRVS